MPVGSPGPSVRPTPVCWRRPGTPTGTDGATWPGCTGARFASTSHFPGVWAGYTAHEGGLHQTVQRIADPEVLAWSEESRRMFGGVWALWAAGELGDRCFTLDW